MIRKHCEVNGISIPEQQALFPKAMINEKALRALIETGAVRKVRTIAVSSVLHVEADAAAHAVAESQPISPLLPNYL